MIGYFKPCRNTLTDQSALTYKAIYCSLCHRLKDRYGFAAAFLLPSDLVFLLLCLDNLTACIDFEDTRIGRCCVCGFHRIPLLSDKNGSHVDRWADAAMFLVSLMSCDHRMDGQLGRLKRCVHRILIDPMIRRNHQTLCRMNIGFESGWAAIRTNLSSEQDRYQRPDDDAVTGSSALIAGMLHRILDPEQRSPLFQDVACQTIRTMYYIDALEDLPDDLKNHHANPLIPIQGSPLRVAVHALETIQSACRIIERLASGQKHREILDHITQRIIGYTAPRAAQSLIKELTDE